MSADAARITYADFIALEEKSLTKHEWLDGVIYDMSGGTPDHAGLKANVIILLGLHLRGKRCRVFDSDLAIRVLATGLFTYPDTSVSKSFDKPHRRNGSVWKRQRPVKRSGSRASNACCPWMTCMRIR